jgi:hypothetical protein
MRHQLSWSSPNRVAWMNLIPPAVRYGNTCERLTNKEAVGGVAPDFLWKAHTWTYPAIHRPKCQTPRRKAGIQHQTYCLPNQCRYSRYPYQLETGALLKSMFPYTRASTLAGLSKDKQSGLQRPVAKKMYTVLFLLHLFLAS